MASYFTVFKTILPYVGTIISAAQPIFTKMGADKPNDQKSTAHQISELQAAASQNSESAKILALQFEKALIAIEENSLDTQNEILKLKKELTPTVEKYDVIELVLKKILYDVQISKFISVLALAISLISVVFIFINMK